VKHILFVCTGNTCRSPLAEGMLRLLAREQGIDLEVKSAGVAAIDGVPASEQTTHILREKGFDEELTSSSLTESLVGWADLILTMTASHKRHAIQRFPEAFGKIYTLKEFIEDDPAVLELVSEMERLYADLQLKQALSQEISDEDRSRIMELEKQLPVYDIADPYGGSLDMYKQTAQEIEQCLHKLIRKLQS
jgi:protein-tyrosine phosphatase